MSAVRRVGRTPTSVPVPPSQTSTAWVTVSWLVSRAAVRALLDPGASLAGETTLSWRFPLNNAGPRAATLTLDGRTAPLLHSNAETRYTLDGDLLHITLPGDTPDRPLLLATLQLSDSGTRPLYVHSSALATLNIPGGRYEVGKASVEGDLPHSR